MRLWNWFTETFLASACLVWMRVVVELLNLCFGVGIELRIILVMNLNHMCGTICYDPAFLPCLMKMDVCVF